MALDTCLTPDSSTWDAVLCGRCRRCFLAEQERLLRYWHDSKGSFRPGPLAEHPFGSRWLLGVFFNLTQCDSDGGICAR